MVSVEGEDCPCLKEAGSRSSGEGVWRQIFLVEKMGEAGHTVPESRLQLAAREGR